MEAGEEVFSMGGECGMKGVTPTPAAFFMERLNIPQLQSQFLKTSYHCNALLLKIFTDLTFDNHQLSIDPKKGSIFYGQFSLIFPLFCDSGLTLEPGNIQCEELQ